MGGVEVGKWKLGVGRRKSEVGSGESEDRSRELEVGRRETGDGSRKLGVGSWKWEDGSWETEVGSGELEDGSKIYTHSFCSVLKQKAKTSLVLSDFGLIRFVEISGGSGKAWFLKLKNTKLQASIVEPVIAVVILVITIAMAFTILTKTNITPIVQAKNKASELISIELSQTINELDFLDKEEQIGAFKLVKKIEQVQQDKAIKLTLQIFDSKHKEIMKKQILIAKSSLPINEKSNKNKK